MVFCLHPELPFGERLTMGMVGTKLSPKACAFNNPFTMNSIVANLRKQLEAKGEFVTRVNIKNKANISTGWFGVNESTWQKRRKIAMNDGREGPNIIFYRTLSNNPRDHYVIPFSIASKLLIKETLSQVKKSGVYRWNMILRDGLLQVTHLTKKFDVSEYFGVRLLVEESDVTITEEVEISEGFREGAVRSILVNAYERNRAARQRCIDHFGRSCSVCNMAFAEFYGPVAAEIIHVHHLLELNKIGKEYEVDPIKDLRPVCPNCHAVIHSRKPAYNIEEATAFVRRAKGPA